MPAPEAPESERPRTEGPVSPTGSIAYRFARFVLRFLLVVLLRPRRYGAEGVPARGALLIVANHQSHLDPPLIGGFLTRRALSFLAREGLFRPRWFGRMLQSFDAIPIREGGGDARAIRAVLERLREGGAVVVFPEGSRSRDGSMRAFRRGVALIVKRSACPVVPVAVEGCYDTWPRTRTWPRVLGCRVAVMYGPPIGHEELMAQGAEAGLARLERDIDAMRLVLRGRLREATRGRFPPPGPGDAPGRPAADVSADAGARAP